ncbi:TonB-dependent receptor domain-containing protein [Polaribacter sp. HL-MS24]|uniref:TonB-dependent receptor domain-containing protein n=1 Tax=Polaribacter sp. HL-MS24 TaxID=3077735 RepID=UPI002934B0A4|nr:TonB-dependent receptor [Polaribacter sp. HL-MS24]WOC40404.1 TonB-dependent receptor [Polaribacter sp. HL-MS24]
MIQKLSLLICCLFTATFLFAQKTPRTSTISINGVVQEAKTKTALEYATIILKETQTKLISGGITDENGIFNINVPKGNYEISVEYISFKRKKLPTQNLTSDTNFGVIQLSEDASSLDEVVIIAEKSTVDIRLDKRIYNVGKDMTVKGGTASDVLDNVPSVSVDVEGNVSLRGNENVRILIDGKPSALVGLTGAEALRQLPADAIEKVEVITSPSARYDAEGTAGILNIILRKGKALGFNGSINSSIGVPDQYQIATNLNQRSKKTNLFSNFGYNYSKGPGNSFTDLKNYSNDVVTSSRIEDRVWQRKRNSFNANVGLEYFLSTKSNLTGTIFYRNTKGGNFSENTIQEFDANSNLTDNALRIQEEDSDDETIQYALNYTNNLGKDGHKLTLDLQYSDSKENETAINKETGFSNESNITNEASKNTLVQADYVLPIGEKSQFEAGYRGDFQDLTSDFLVSPISDPDFDPSNNLEFKQDIHAFYTQYGNKFNKLSFLLGLRLEVTDVKVRLLNTNKNNDFSYKELFPTLNIGFEATEDQSITIGYSRRLRRPRFWYLNPFESRNSQNIIFKGNPGLTPTFTNSFDLGYLNKIGKLTLNGSVYYQHSTNTISRVTRQEIREINGNDESVLIREPINLASEDRYGFEFTSNFTASKTVRLDGSFNVFNSKTEGIYTYDFLDPITNTTTTISEDLSNSNTSWRARFNTRIRLPYQIEWQTRLSYRGPSESAQDVSEGIFSANLAFSKDVFKEKGTLVLNVSDLFNSRKRASVNYAPNRDTPTNISNQTFQWRERQISLNFTYRFNQKKKQERGGRNPNDGGEGFEG